MRGWLAIVVAGCGAAAPAPPASQPIALGGEPAPSGTWHVELEVTGWVARSSRIAVDATGVYVIGPALRHGKVEERRWVVAKLDRASGAVLWSVVDDVANGPMPEHLALGDGVLIVAGHESNYAKQRSLVIERREPATGALRWRRVIPEGRTGTYSLGGIALHGTSVLYAATLGQGRPQALYGELSVASGTPVRAHLTRADRRGRDIAITDGGVYLLADDRDNKFTLERLDASWTSVETHAAGQVLRLAPASDGLVAWFGAIEKYAASGERVWTSALAGSFVDVAVDPSGIYATAMLDASAKAYYALAKLDPATGAIAWKRRTAAYEESRPISALAVDDTALYVLGYVGDRLFVERRRKSDGAIGSTEHTVQALVPQQAPQLAH